MPEQRELAILALRVVFCLPFEEGQYWEACFVPLLGTLELEWERECNYLKKFKWVFLPLPPGRRERKMWKRKASHNWISTQWGSTVITESLISSSFTLPCEEIQADRVRDGDNAWAFTPSFEIYATLLANIWLSGLGAFYPWKFYPRAFTHGAFYPRKDRHQRIGLRATLLIINTTTPAARQQWTEEGWFLSDHAQHGVAANRHSLILHFSLVHTEGSGQNVGRC